VSPRQHFTIPRDQFYAHVEAQGIFDMPWFPTTTEPERSPEYCYYVWNGFDHLCQDGTHRHICMFPKHDDGDHACEGCPERVIELEVIPA